MKKTRILPSLATLAAGLTLLFAGGMLYVLYRPQSLLLFHVADALGLSPVIGQWREEASGLGDLSSTAGEFTVYCLPAGLWAASYVLITATLAHPLAPLKRHAAVVFIPLLGAVSELMQAARLLPGTFDPTDLLLYLAPLAAYAILETINNK